MAEVKYFSREAVFTQQSVLLACKLKVTAVAAAQGRSACPAARAGTGSSAPLSAVDCCRLSPAQTEWTIEETDDKEWFKGRIRRYRSGHELPFRIDYEDGEEEWGCFRNDFTIWQTMEDRRKVRWTKFKPSIEAPEGAATAGEAPQPQPQPQQQQQQQQQQGRGAQGASARASRSASSGSQTSEDDDSDSDAEEADGAERAKPSGGASGRAVHNAAAAQQQGKPAVAKPGKQRRSFSELAQEMTEKAAAHKAKRPKVVAEHAGLKLPQPAAKLAASAKPAQQQQQQRRQQQQQQAAPKLQPRIAPPRPVAAAPAAAAAAAAAGAQAAAPAPRAPVSPEFRPTSLSPVAVPTTMAGAAIAPQQHAPRQAAAQATPRLSAPVPAAPAPPAADPSQPTPGSSAAPRPNPAQPEQLIQMLRASAQQSGGNTKMRSAFELLRRKSSAPAGHSATPSAALTPAAFKSAASSPGWLPGSTPPAAAAAAAPATAGRDVADSALAEFQDGLAGLQNVRKQIERFAAAALQLAPDVGCKRVISALHQRADQAEKPAQKLACLYLLHELLKPFTASSRARAEAEGAQVGCAAARRGCSPPFWRPCLQCAARSTLVCTSDECVASGRPNTPQHAPTRPNMPQHAPPAPLPRAQPEGAELHAALPTYLAHLVRVVACDGDNLGKVERLLDGWASTGIYQLPQLARAQEALAERRAFILPADSADAQGQGQDQQGGSQLQASGQAQGQMRRYTLYRPGKAFGPEILDFRLGCMWGSMAKLEPWLAQKLQLPFQLQLDNDEDLGADEELAGWAPQPAACTFKSQFEELAAADPVLAQRLQVRPAPGPAWPWRPLYSPRAAGQARPGQARGEAWVLACSRRPTWAARAARPACRRRRVQQAFTRPGPGPLLQVTTPQRMMEDYLRMQQQQQEQVVEELDTWDMDYGGNGEVEEEVGRGGLAQQAGEAQPASAPSSPGPAFVAPPAAPAWEMPTQEEEDMELDDYRPGSAEAPQYGSLGGSPAGPGVLAGQPRDLAGLGMGLPLAQAQASGMAGLPQQQLSGAPWHLPQQQPQALPPQQPQPLLLPAQQPPPQQQPWHQQQPHQQQLVPGASGLAAAPWQQQQVLQQQMQQTASATPQQQMQMHPAPPAHLSHLPGVGAMGQLLPAAQPVQQPPLGWPQQQQLLPPGVVRPGGMAVPPPVPPPMPDGFHQQQAQQPLQQQQMSQPGALKSSWQQLQLDKAQQQVQAQMHVQHQAQMQAQQQAQVLLQQQQQQQQQQHRMAMPMPGPPPAGFGPPPHLQHMQQAAGMQQQLQGVPGFAMPPPQLPPHRPPMFPPAPGERHPAARSACSPKRAAAPLPCKCTFSTPSRQSTAFTHHLPLPCSARLPAAT
jgi:hypothetical protein